MSFSEAGVNFAGPLPERVYMDHNATTPLCPAARDAMTAALGVWGNPSSIHAEGRAARDWVERARRQVAQFLGSDSGDGIIFTSGGTEADCLGILGLAGLARRRGQPARVLSTAIEHPAVSGACAALVARGFAVHTVAVDGDGRIDREDFARHCRDGAALAVLSAANHELGTVQDVAGLAALAAEHGVLVHCDAVQAAGKIALTPATTGVASVALSGHKIYGPKGVGVLWVRSDLALEPLAPAGHQERERRPGTENVPGIVGLGAAAEVAAQRLADDGPRIAALTAQLEAGLAGIERTRIHGGSAPRVGNTVNAGFAGALGESVVAALDLAGFSVSTGAACTSGSVEPSPVLLGIGQSPERAREAVRFSLGRATTAEHVAALLAVLPEIVARARRFR